MEVEEGDAEDEMVTGLSDNFTVNFMHLLLDIATKTAKILHCDVSALTQVKLTTHKDFQSELIPQLCRWGQQKSTDHTLTAIAMVQGTESESHKGPAHQNKQTQPHHI